MSTPGDDSNGFLDFQCFPHKMRKAPTKQGKIHRAKIGCFCVMNVFFLVIAFWQLLGLWSVMRQFIYIYLNYHIYMTLSRIGTLFYLLVAVLGNFYAIFDALSISSSTTTMTKFLI